MKGETIKNNLDELLSRTDNMRQFHALIPAKLIRQTAFDGPYMNATFEWDEVDRNGLVRKLDDKVFL